MTAEARGWQRWSLLYAIVSFGFSQIFLNMARVNPAAFPASLAFVLWTLFWIQLLPLAILLLLTRWLEKRLRVLDAVLVSLLIASLIKQVQVFHEAAYVRWLGFLPPVAVYLAAASFALWMMGFWQRAAGIVRLYLAYAGICALALPAIFIYSTFQVRSGFKTAAALPGQCGPATRSVYMIIFDELSADLLMKNGRIDRELFPHFAALADDSLWFRNATTNHWSTVDSIPTILTGKIRPSPQDRNLLQRLPQSFEKKAILTEIEVENWMRRGQSESRLYRGKAHFLNRSPLATGAFIGYRLWGFLTFELPQNILFDDPEFHVTLKQEEQFFLKSIRRDSPQLLVWHSSLPHSPFLFDQTGKRHGQHPDFFPFAKEYRKSMFPEILQRYREQIRYADRVLGAAIDRMKAERVYQDSVLIVTSDHGVRIWGDLFSHVDSIARVPVFLRIPGKPAEIRDTGFQLCDLTPTLLQALGCQADPSNFDGYSALDNTQLEERAPTVHFYPAEFVCVFDTSTNTWLRRSKPESGTAAVTKTLASPQRGFFAVQVLDDVMAAREDGRDFLTLYMDRHFPESVSNADRLQLQDQIAAMQNAPETPPLFFKRGMYYFFLALTETHLLEAGHPIEAATVHRHWVEAVDQLKRAGSLQPWVAVEIEQLLIRADRDGDLNLNKEELADIIRSRTR